MMTYQLTVEESIKSFRSTFSLHTDNSSILNFGWNINKIVLAIIHMTSLTTFELKTWCITKCKLGAYHWWLGKGLLPMLVLRSLDKILSFHDLKYVIFMLKSIQTSQYRQYLCNIQDHLIFTYHSMILNISWS